MRVSIYVAALAIGGLAMQFQASAQTQGPASGNGQAAGSPQAQPAAAAQPRTIGVIDIGHILQNHPMLKGKMEGVKSQMESADKDMQSKREAIIKKMEQLRERFNEGTPEYDQAEKQIAEEDTTFRLELVKKRKEFENAQAEILFEVHGQITQLLKYLNEKMGVQVVLQVSRQAVDPKKPETIEIAMSQNVLYFDQNIDLTNWVLEALQKQLGSAAPAQTQSARGPAGRAGQPLR